MLPQIREVAGGVVFSKCLACTLAARPASVGSLFSSDLRNINYL